MVRALLSQWAAGLSSNTLCFVCAVAHLAAVEGHLHCFKFLVRKMANLMDTLKARNDHGDTPRDLAERFYKDNILQYIDGVEKEKEQPETQESEYGIRHTLKRHYV